MDDRVQGYKVECNVNEASCKESSCEGLHFQFTTRKREKLQYPNNICGGQPSLFGEQQPNLALHGDAFLGCSEGQKEYRKGYWTCAQRQGAWTCSPSGETVLFYLQTQRNTQKHLTGNGRTLTDTWASTLALRRAQGHSRQD